MAMQTPGCEKHVKGGTNTWARTFDLSRPSDISENIFNLVQRIQ